MNTIDFFVDSIGANINDIKIVKNNAAQVWWPEFNFNGIGDMQPGEGYQVKMLNEDILNY